MDDLNPNSKPEPPNQEALWAGKSGERWLANLDSFEEMIGPIGDALINNAGFAPGAYVIDIGCGAGATSLEIARRVGPSGEVLGLDISPVLITTAASRAKSRGVGNVRFLLGDAALVMPDFPKADWICSRFGVMFFSKPFEAFRHLRGLLKPGGKLVMACWGPLAENPWRLEVRQILARHFEIPTPAPRSPGPFAFEDRGFIFELLTKSGFGDVEIASWKRELFVGGTGNNPVGVAAFLLKATSEAQVLDDAPAALRAKVHAELAERLKIYDTETGVQMTGSVWMVSARC